MRLFATTMLACLLAILITVPSKTYAAFLMAESEAGTAPPQMRQARDLTNTDIESLLGRKMNGFEKLSFKLQKKKLSKLLAKGEVTSEKTNGNAIGGLITAFLLPPLGIILSIVALKQIKKTGEKGHGMAIAGLVIGSLLTGLIILFILAAAIYGFA